MRKIAHLRAVASEPRRIEQSGTTEKRGKPSPPYICSRDRLRAIARLADRKRTIRVAIMALEATDTDQDIVAMLLDEVVHLDGIYDTLMWAERNEREWLESIRT